MAEDWGLGMSFLKTRLGRAAASALALGAALTLAGARAQAGQDKPAPSLEQLKKTKLTVDTGNQQQIWAAVMKTLGAYDAREKCWTLEARDRLFCMQPAKFAMRGAKNGNDYFFAISGKEKGASGLKRGVAMFMHFATVGDAKTFTFKELDGLYEFGSRQAPPDDKHFRFVEVAIDTYAWEVTDASPGTGWETETTSLIHVGGVFTPKQKRMADFVTYRGNETGCGAQKKVACASDRIDYAFKPGAGGFFALELTLKKKMGDREIFALGDASPVIRSTPLTIPFDSREGRYLTPSQDMVEWMGRRLPAKLAIIR
jgi:hypothetical protein